MSGCHPISTPKSTNLYLGFGNNFGIEQEQSRTYQTTKLRFGVGMAKMAWRVRFQWQPGKLTHFALSSFTSSLRVQCWKSQTLEGCAWKVWMVCLHLRCCCTSLPFPGCGACGGRLPRGSLSSTCQSLLCWHSWLCLRACVQVSKSGAFVSGGKVLRQARWGRQKVFRPTPFDQQLFALGRITGQQNNFDKQP